MGAVSKSTQKMSKLKARRLENKLTQKQLATQFNDYIDKHHLKIKHTSYTTISRWESLVIEPKETVINVLASVLDTSPRYIRGYELPTKEKEEQVGNLIGNLYIVYSHDDTEIKIFLNEFFYDDFVGLFDVYADNYTNWRDFDVTSALDDYLKIFYPDLRESLHSKTYALSGNDEEKLHKSISKIVPNYLKPFIKKLTEDVDKRFHIEDGHWFDSNTISFITQWFKEQTTVEINKRYPEYKKISKFYENNISLPLMDLEDNLDPLDSLLTKEKPTSKDIQKQVDSIKSALDKYALMVNKLL